MKTLRQSSAIAGNNLKENYEQHLRHKFLVFHGDACRSLVKLRPLVVIQRGVIYALDAVKNV